MNDDDDDDKDTESDAPTEGTPAPELFAGGRVEPAKRREQPGRNEPCWCGSGKKYKRCHSDADERDDRERLDNQQGDGVGFAIAEALLEIAGEELGELDTVEECARLLDVVALAWNLDVLEEIGDTAGRTELIATLTTTGPERAALDAVVDEMIARKQELFPGESRLVMKVSIGVDGEVRVVTAQAQA
jgi:SEC-C motif-containing protein